MWQIRRNWREKRINMKIEIRRRLEAVRRGEVPEGYKKTKVGIVPEGWELGSLKDILHLETRSVPKPDKPYWRLGLLSHAKGTFHELIENPETVQMDVLYQVKDKDLIVNITFAWEHAIALAGENDEGMLVSHRFPTYVFNKKMSPEFFGAIVRQKWFKELLVNISPGGAGRNRVMSKSAFLKLPCFIPPYSEQQKIAEILDAYEKVIRLKENLLAEKRNQKKWLLENLLDPNSGVRLLGFKEEWEERSLEELGVFSKGFGISNDDCQTGESPCIKYGDIYMHYNYFVDKPVSYTENDIANKSKIVNAGTLLFTGSGEDPLEIGKCVAYLGKEKIAVGGDIIIMVPYNVNPLFLSYQQYTAKLINRKAELSQGYSVVHIYVDQIKSLRVFIPPTIKEQEAIANVLFQMDNEINLLDKELKGWSIMKKVLMQVLLTGIVRVNFKEKS